jgi:hypothetical protein
MLQLTGKAPDDDRGRVRSKLYRSLWFGITYQQMKVAYIELMGYLKLNVQNVMLVSCENHTVVFK